jgi:hypothetical protein
MTDRPTAPKPLISCTALLVALVLLQTPAAARSRVHGLDHHRTRPILRVRPVPPVPPPVLVRGYLPRNHNIPMYNEPPRREPVW